MKNSKVVCALIIILLVVVAAFVCVRQYKKSTALPVSESGWQAVFLEGGQVYFGHLEKYNSAFYQLTNVYYLKYGNSLQQSSDAPTTTQEQKLNLIKLGGELHGPENLMYIAQNKVLFIENLKNSSSVVQAIKK